MLPELILKEERKDDFLVLFGLGLFSSLAGFAAALVLFPSQLSVLSVIFASIPLVYPLTTKFLDDEKEEGDSYLEEVEIYGSLFLGQALGFMLVSFFRPGALSLQASVAGISGNAVSPGFFFEVLSNNLMVFSGILTVSAVIGSAGAFILVWNASVLGKFFASLISRLNGFDVFTGTSEMASPLAYIPHASFEMAGFIIAGVSGSMVSAAVYREHFDSKTWFDIAKLILIGLACILTGAVLEAS